VVNNYSIDVSQGPRKAVDIFSTERSVAVRRRRRGEEVDLARRSPTSCMSRKTCSLFFCLVVLID